MRPDKCYITVTHGNLTVNIPRDLFTGPDCEFVPDRTAEFRKMIGRRYPWLSENSIDVLMRNARNEMINTIDQETGGRVASRQMASKGKYSQAIAHLKEHLERDPQDADSWYALGELLCKAGKVEEGYRAMNRGRSLSEK